MNIRRDFSIEELAEVDPEIPDLWDRCTKAPWNDPDSLNLFSELRDRRAVAEQRLRVKRVEAWRDKTQGRPPIVSDRQRTATPRGHIIRYVPQHCRLCRRTEVEAGARCRSGCTPRVFHDIEEAHGVCEICGSENVRASEICPRWRSLPNRYGPKPDDYLGDRLEAEGWFDN